MADFAWDSQGGSMFGATTWDDMPISMVGGDLTGGTINFGKMTTAGAGEVTALAVAVVVVSVFLILARKRK